MDCIHINGPIQKTCECAPIVVHDHYLMLECEFQISRHEDGVRWTRLFDIGNEQDADGIVVCRSVPGHAVFGCKPNNVIICIDHTGGNTYNKHEHAYLHITDTGIPFFSDTWRHLKIVLEYCTCSVYLDTKHVMSFPIAQIRNIERQYVYIGKSNPKHTGELQKGLFRNIRIETRSASTFCYEEKDDDFPA